MASVFASIASEIVATISTLGQGIATGIGDTLQALFVTTSEAGVHSLSITGGIIVGFASIALGLGVVRLCVGFIFGLGKGRL